MTKGLTQKLTLQQLAAIFAVYDFFDLSQEEIKEDQIDLINYHINLAIRFGSSFYEAITFRKGGLNLAKLERLVGKHVYLSDGTTPIIESVFLFENRILVKFDNRPHGTAYKVTGVPAYPGNLDYIFGEADVASYSTTEQVTAMVRETSSLGQQIADIESGNVIDR